MVHSLNFRLLAAFAVVIIAVIGSAFFLAHRTARIELDRFEERVAVGQEDRVQTELARYYRLTGGWNGVQAVVEQWGGFFQRRIILTDARGTVIADSAATLIGQPYAAEQPGHNMFRMPGMVAIGSVYVAPGESPDISGGSLEITYNSIGGFFLWGGLIAVAAAILLTFILSRHILAPVKAIASAARRFGRGDFSRRVKTDVKGELGELAQSFNTMAEDLERTQRLRRNMVADIAHELRTPLSNLSGYLEAIRDGVIKADEGVIRSLNEEASTLARLIHDLQELSLADAGELKLVTRTEDIARLIRETATSLKPKSATRGLSLATRLGRDLPRVAIDSQRIRQVLHNLLENAMAHTPEGGKITVAARAEGKMVSVSVSDTGEGMAAAELPLIFERFYRVDKSRTRETGGSGLGLTIARRLVEAHGGTIKAESQPGQGSTFTFSVPAAKPAK